MNYYNQIFTIPPKPTLLARLKKLALAGWLPLALALLFVVQNQAFNSWLDIKPDEYLIRRSLVTFALGLILYGPAIFFKKRGRYIYLFTISLLVSLIFIAQYLYFEYAGAFLQASSIKYAKLAAAQTGTIVTLLTNRLFLFIINIIFCLNGILVETLDKNKEIHLSVGEKFASLVMIAVVVFTGYGHLLRVEAKEWGNTALLSSNTYDLDAFVSKVGIVNFFLEDVSRRVFKANKATEADKEFVKNWQAKSVESKKEKKYFGLAKNRNLILIQVESLENSVINKNLGDQAITPELNQLIKEGFYFDNYYAHVSAGNTADAEFAVLNSLYPLPNNVAFIDYAKNQYFALPKLLTQNGYGTYVFHGDVSTFWNRANIYPQLGYQKWFGRQDYTADRKVGSGFDLGDEEFFDQTIPKLKVLPQPFMAMLMTLSSHTPFALPADLQTLKIPEQTKLDQTQKQYLQSIHYVDYALGKFIKQLKESGLYDNSLILIYGDHGSYTHISDKINADNQAVYGLINSQVPLIILAPKTDLLGTSQIPSSHIDLYPTLANLAGLKAPSSTLGLDLFNTDAPVITHRKNISGLIDVIATNNLAYVAAEDGIFEHGSCQSLPHKITLDITDCQEIFNQQSDIIRVSDTAIKANLLSSLND